MAHRALPKKKEAKNAALGAKPEEAQAKKNANAAGGGGKRRQARQPFLVAAKGIASVRSALLDYFRHVFLSSSAFKAAFGERSWPDIEDEVRADIERFGLDSDSEIFREPNGSATYTGRVFGLYTEVSVEPGDDPKVFIELD